MKTFSAQVLGFVLSIILFFLLVPSPTFSAGQITNVCGNCNSNNEGGLPSCSCNGSICYSSSQTPPAGCGTGSGTYCQGGTNASICDSWGNCSSTAPASCGAPGFWGNPGYTDIYGSKTNAGTPGSRTYTHCDGTSGCAYLYRATSSNYTVWVDNNGTVTAKDMGGNVRWSDSGYCRVQLDTYDTTLGGSPTSFVVWRDPNLCSSSCAPNCSGKNCGDDGCGGSCGTCSSGYTCSSGVCTQNPYYNNVSPTNGATGVSLNPTFTWSTNNPFNSGGYSCYHIYSNSSGTTEIAGSCVNGSGLSASYSGNVLTYGTPYWWNVHGYSSSTNYWATSPVWGFTTLTNPTPTCSISASPTAIPYNTSSTVTWNSTNATSCSIAPTGWSGTNGSQSTGNLTTTTTYTETCSNGPNTCNASATVTVTPPSIFKVFGGNVTSKTNVTDSWLPASQYISNN